MSDEEPENLTLRHIRDLRERHARDRERIRLLELEVRAMREMISGLSKEGELMREADASLQLRVERLEARGGIVDK